LRRYREALTQGAIGGDIPDCLVELGLLRPSADDPTLLSAVPPDIAGNELRRPMERAVLVQQHTIAAIKEVLAAAEDVYREEHRVSGTAVRLLRGAEVIRAALQQARDDCRDELVTA